jgi:serine/threonine protein kinase/Tfp pilus assembly protein PilF
MKTASTVCRNCGGKIFGDEPKGLCLACVLETGLGPLIDDSVTGGVDSGPPAVVLMDFGDYELLEEIGRGGQGVVYRAHQKSLNRTVALKVIGLGQWATQAHLKRFRREAESAASLDHPCIVPIYEVGEREGSCYFSMKFVDGGQLDEVAKRQPISPRNAAELIAKLARTVHYAHEHGILHRDIKPGNILLDTKGEPHLTDFGLARLLEKKSTVTNTMDVLGTPSYMAPEQARGDQGAAVSSPPRDGGLTRAVDVYGLGAVLYQLLTGQPPFAGGTTYETIKSLLDTEPRPPRSLNRKVDRDLSTICLKCLEKDPKRRYSSALALAEDLEHWLKHEPIRARHIGIFGRGKKWLQRNPTTALVLGLSLAFVATLAVMIWKSASVRSPATAESVLNLAAPEKSIAVLPFENLSRDPDNAYFADGIQEEILTRLAKIADLKVISRTSTRRYQSKPQDLGQIAKQLGVANLLEGSVQKVADQVRVNVQLVNAQTDSHLWADSYDRKLTDILGVESEIAKRIAESLQAKLSGHEEQALAVKPTNNPQAYDAYLRGLAFEARWVYEYSDDALRKATESFEQAVQLEPKFAIAWARLSRAHAQKYFRSEGTAFRRDSAKQALENAQQLEPNSPETQLAQGYYQLWVERDYSGAKATFGRVSKMLPGSSEVPTAVGRIAAREGHWDQSIAYFEQALAFDPRNPGLLRETASLFSYIRQFAGALKLYDHALDIISNDADLMASKAGIYQAEGNLQEAARFLSGVTEQTPNDGAVAIKITQLRLERNYQGAIRFLQNRLAQFHYFSEWEKDLDWEKLALTRQLAGDTAGAKIIAGQARATLESLCKNRPDDCTLGARMSLFNAVLGQNDAAVKEAERAIMLWPSAKDRLAGPTREENLALIQTIVGENDRAVAILAQLLQTPYYSWLYGTPVTPALLRLDPIWDTLRGDPRFQKLCEEKQDLTTNGH